MKSEILKHFEDMEDPRVVGRTIHPLRNIVFITIVGALCGLTGWEEIADCKGEPEMQDIAPRAKRRKTESPPRQGKGIRKTSMSPWQAATNTLLPASAAPLREGDSVWQARPGGTPPAIPMPPTLAVPAPACKAKRNGDALFGNDCDSCCRCVVAGCADG